MNQTALPKEIARKVNQAISHCERFKKTKEIEELSKAIDLLASAIQDGFSHGLGSSLQFSTQSTLSEEIALIESKITSSQTDDETRILEQERLAELLRQRRAQTGKISSLGQLVLQTAIIRHDSRHADIEHRLKVLEWYETERRYGNCLRMGRQLGDLLYDHRRFAEAYQPYATAAKALEELRRTTLSGQDRQKQNTLNADLYARLVRCCLMTNEKELVFEYATAGKGRAFVDLLSSAQVDLTNVDNQNLAQKLQQSREVRGQIDGVMAQWLAEVSSKIDRKSLQKQLREKRQEENTLWQQIRDQHPDYFATQSAAPFTLAEARDLAHELDATLVSYYRHAAEWVAFVIRADVPVEESLKVVELAVTDEQLREWGLKFNRGLATRKLTNLRWSQKLSDALITPLLTHLPAANQASPARLVLAPFSLLHLLPLATLPRTKIPWRKSGLTQVKYLSDEYVVAITPSLAMLKRVIARRQREEKREKLCAVAYPGRKGSKHYLKHVLPEVQAIAPLFSHSTTLLHSAATRQAAIDHGAMHDVVHYSCHGLFDVEEVEQSGLLLAGGEMLTLRDVFNNVRLPNASLVTLSACETGLALPRQGDDLSGLIQGFVYAGTPAVIASLWAVNDAATRYLINSYGSMNITHLANPPLMRCAAPKKRCVNMAIPTPTIGGLFKRQEAFIRAFPQKRNVLFAQPKPSSNRLLQAKPSKAKESIV